MSRVVPLVFYIAVALIPAWSAHAQTGSEPSSNDKQHMPEDLRSSVEKVVVIAGQNPTGQEITGSYEKDTLGLEGGMDAGTRMGTISKDVGPVPIDIPIPILTFPAAIIGGISGVAQREIQEFRDAMTKDLAQTANQPLTNDGLATDVYHGLRSVPRLDTRIFAATTPIPEDTQAVLYVSVDGVVIDVQGKEAILTTTARATLHRLSDGRNLYQAVAQYQDRDTLDHWTENDYALWHDYANFARHYLGREISAQAFDRIELSHELRPVESATVSRVKKNEWQGVSKTSTPTLAWELILLGGDSYGPWVDEIDESGIYYDLEIYDPHTLVYAVEQIQDHSHTLEYEIETCKTYRWSVRPSYHVSSDIKYGEWMRFDLDNVDDVGTGNGNIGRKASGAPAYIQDFASLEIKCGRR